MDREKDEGVSKVLRGNPTYKIPSSSQGIGPHQFEKGSKGERLRDEVSKQNLQKEDRRGIRGKQRR